MLTGEQIRAARALARMEQATLAEASGVSLPTVKRLEKMVGPISANTGTETALRKALGNAGVLFIDPNGEGPGVRMRPVWRVDFAKAGGGFTVHPVSGQSPRLFDIFPTQELAREWLGSHGYRMISADPDLWVESA